MFFGVASKENHHPLVRNSACSLAPTNIYLVSWSLGEEAIWSGPPDEGGLSELILKDCWSDDMGVYKIQVTNPLGSDESTCNVIVQQRLKVSYSASKLFHKQLWCGI